jgi:hypothetical protein
MLLMSCPCPPTTLSIEDHQPLKRVREWLKKLPSQALILSGWNITTWIEGGDVMKSLVITSSTLFVLMFCFHPLAVAGHGNLKIAKVNSKLILPKLYANLGADWWQWALQAPAANTPLDDDGTNCRVGQQGTVWFLAGTIGSGDPTTPTERNCDVPYGKAIFFPVLTSGYFGFINDPPEQRTAEYVRSATNTCNSNTVQNLSVVIDGMPVKSPTKYYTSSAQSPIFQIQLPTDNFLGVTADDVPELMLSPSAHQGFYIYISPLPPGPHTIEWTGSWDCNGSATTENMKYNLNVLTGVTGEVQ